MATEWYDRREVRMGCWAVSHNREVKWLANDGEVVVGFRQRRIAYSDSMGYDLKCMDYENRPIGMFVSTAILNWKEIPFYPPNLRASGKPNYNDKALKAYKASWDLWLTPQGCREMGMNFKEVWLGRNMIWDFDSPEAPLLAFEYADKVGEYLEGLEYHPLIVFSGNKGFHVWLPHDESAELAGIDWDALADNEDDPLRVCGKIYADYVSEVAYEATGEHIPLMDLSPNYRQGVVRCPFSINEKSGQVVWPLTKPQREQLRDIPANLVQEMEVHHIGEILHGDTVDNQGLGEAPTAVPLEKTVTRRWEQSYWNPTSSSDLQRPTMQ